MAAGLILRHLSVETPLGALLVVVSPHGVVMTAFEDEEPGAALERAERALEAPARRAQGELANIRREIEDYFAGVGRTFTAKPDLRLATAGFPRRVLAVTARIPHGVLRTYGDVAAEAGSPRAARAAGNALARCPIELFVPCHRVVHAGGSIGGYGRYEHRKRWLLRHEGRLGGVVRDGLREDGRSEPLSSIRRRSGAGAARRVHGR